MTPSTHSAGLPLRGPRVAVVGAGSADAQTLETAEAVGRGLGAAKALLICGGRGGVMAAAARGCRAAGGVTLGILPGASAAETGPNDWIDIAVYTGAGQGRNLIVVLSAEAVIAVGGGWGTLSEIALARKHDRPVVLLGDWQIVPPDGDLGHGLHRADTAAEAVSFALDLAGGRT